MLRRLFPILLVQIILINTGCDKSDVILDPPVYKRYIIKKVTYHFWYNEYNTWFFTDTIFDYGKIILYKDSTAKFEIDSLNHCKSNYCLQLIDTVTNKLIIRALSYHMFGDTIIHLRLNYGAPWVANNDPGPCIFRIYKVDSKHYIWNYYFHFHISDTSPEPGEDPWDDYADHKFHLEEY